MQVVEDDYDGPRLSEDGITKEFVEELIERFKEQKKIHKKYAYKVSCFNFPLHSHLLYSVSAGLSFRARRGEFPLAVLSLTTGCFLGKQMENKTKRTY